MKKAAAISVLIFFVVSLSGAQTMQQQRMQANTGQNQPGMCKMHQKMMMKQKPMKPIMMMVKMLPMMAEELDLTEEQMNKIMDLKGNHMVKMAEMKAKKMKESMKMKKLFRDMASVEMVRNQMQKCSEIKIDMKMACYQTAKEMKEVLNEEQKESLKNMLDECMMSNCQMGMMQNDDQ